VTKQPSAEYAAQLLNLLYIVANKQAQIQVQEIKPQDQLKGDANICMHDLANQDYLSPQWHCSKQPVEIQNQVKFSMQV